MNEEQRNLYGRLIGTWDVGNRYRGDDGQWRHGTAVWTFAWTLAGNAVQDVMWFTESDGSRTTGTTVRLYDPADDHWHVVWFAPRGKTVTLIGRPGDDGDIVQEGRRLGGPPVRWLFTAVTGDSFRWLGYLADDDGATWHLEQEMLARRRTRDI